MFVIKYVCYFPAGILHRKDSKCGEQAEKKKYYNDMRNRWLRNERTDDLFL